MAKASGDPALRALAHPLRLRMLSLMWAEAHSATGLAAALDIGHGLATQHLRRLVACDLVQLVETRPGRGGGERFFRTVQGPVLSERADDAVLLAQALAVTLRQRAHRRAPGPGVVVDADLWVTPQVWETFRADLAALVDGLHAHGRGPSDPDCVPVGVTLMAFRLLGVSEPPEAGRPARP